MLSTILLITSSCAKIGTISGGQKDKTPPVILKSTPANKSTNFKGNRIRIDFDEYIVIKEVSSQLNISPPLNKKPLVNVRDKSIVIDFRDTLKANTTYTLNFGDAISDNNEGNILKNYEFAFSTGDFLDSLGVKGIILNNNTLKPEKETITAMLYDDFSDSAIFLKLPLYVGKTNKFGQYFINNVKKGTYRLFALKDDNKNFKYNTPSEMIAFSDSLITLSPEGIPKNIEPHLDTIIGKPKKPEFTIVDGDTLVPDSSAIKNSKYSLSYNLFIFKEKEIIQYLKDNSRKDKHRIDLVFNIPLIKDSIALKPIYYNVNSFYIKESNTNNDSISFWLTDSTLYNSDTLKMALSYIGTDKHGNYKSKTDTLNFRYVTSELKNKKKKPLPEKMKLTVTPEQTISSRDKIGINTSFPINAIDSSSIQLFIKVDTLFQVCNFTLQKHPKSLRDWSLQTNWKEEAKYKLVILPSAFQNIYQIEKDTIIKEFTINKSEIYGTLKVIISKAKSPIIIQLLDGEKVLAQKNMKSDGTALFDYLNPKKYSLRIIFDTNQNGVWDTGNLIQKLQPERILLYDEELNIRSNWEKEINWIVK